MTGGAQSGQGAVSHTPDKSGLPSAVRGAGAFKSTLPSDVFGTPGAENAGHCAWSGARAIADTTSVDARRSFFTVCIVIVRPRRCQKPRGRSSHAFSSV